MNYRNDLYGLQTVPLLHHYHCPSHLGMFSTDVLECPTRREGIAERLPRVEQTTLPRVSSGEHYGRDDYTMRDFVLVGPGHSGAENYLDVRGRVRILPDENVRDTESHLFLLNLPPHRTVCSKVSVHRGDC